MSSAAVVSGSSAATSSGVTEVVGTGDDGKSTGSRGNALSIIGEAEKRRVLADKPLGLNRPAVAGLPVRGLESLWFDFLGAASITD